jgi:hypothetical protein
MDLARIPFAPHNISLGQNSVFVQIGLASAMLSRECAPIIPPKKNTRIALKPFNGGDGAAASSFDTEGGLF